MVYVYDNNPILRSETELKDVSRYAKLCSLINDGNETNTTELHLHPEKLVQVRGGKKRTLKYNTALSDEELWNWLLSVINGTLKGEASKSTKSPYQAVIDAHRYAADNGGYVEFCKETNVITSLFKINGADSPIIETKTNNISELYERCVIFRNAVANLCLKTESVKIKWAEYDRLRAMMKENGIEL